MSERTLPTGFRIVTNWGSDGRIAGYTLGSDAKFLDGKTMSVRLPESVDDMRTLGRAILALADEEAARRG